MPEPDFSSVLLLLLSPAAGSFLAVLVDRLPRGEDVVRRRSACRGCAAPLAPRDLLPVLSFALARGRCRHCGATIPAWHLYLEIAAPGLALLALLAGGGPVQVWLTTLVLWLLLTLAASDLVWMRLPDPLTGALVLVALLRAGLTGLTGAGPLPEAFWGALIEPVIGAVIGAGLGAGSFWLIRHLYARLRGREGLGAGDVKLMAGIGAFCGPAWLPHVVLAGALAAVAAVLLRAVRSGRRPGATDRLPFGAALCAGAALIWLLGAVGLLGRVI